jgi:hypothetical protein
MCLLVPAGHLQPPPPLLLLLLAAAGYLDQLGVLLSI